MPLFCVAMLLTFWGCGDDSPNETQANLPRGPGELARVVPAADPPWPPIRSSRRSWRRSARVRRRCKARSAGALKQARTGLGHDPAQDQGIREAHRRTRQARPSQGRQGVVEQAQPGIRRLGRRTRQGSPGEGQGQGRRGHRRTENSCMACHRQHRGGPGGPGGMGGPPGGFRPPGGPGGPGGALPPPGGPPPQSPGGPAPR